MVTTRTLLLVLCLIPIMILSGERDLRITFDYASYKTYQDDIRNMLKQKRATNKALTVYRQESMRWNEREKILSKTKLLRLSNSPKKLFTKKHYRRIREIMRENEAALSPVLECLYKSTQYRSHTGQAAYNNFKSKFTVLTRDSLKKRGVAFPEIFSDTQADHAAFLKANAHISRQAAAYLIPASFMLYYSEHLKLKIFGSGLF